MAGRWLGAILVLACGCGHGEPEKHIDSMTVEITGRALEWIVRYPGNDGVLGTADDVLDRQNLHVPVTADITVLLRSDDYAYTFALPAQDCREIAVPNLLFSVRFRPGTPGTFEIRGDDMCGGDHSKLQGKLIVESQSSFRSWLKQGSK